MSKVLVLGANGFIGSHIVDSLVNNSHQVRAFDRFSNNEYNFHTDDLIEIFPGNYLNKDDLRRALSGVEYVFHFISTTTPAASDNDPLIDVDTNIRMSIELFKLCVEAGIKKVIFASTSGAMYGNDSINRPYNEDDVPKPISPYAIGKLAIEHYLRYFRIKHGLNSLVLRISNPYGERQPFNRKQGVIPIFIENILKGNALTVFGDGSMTRDYIYVKDLTDGIVSIFQKDTRHTTYNIGSGVATSVNDIINNLKSVISKNIKIEHKEIPPTFVSSVNLDTTRFDKEFGSLSKTQMSIGIQKTYDYISSEMYKS